MRGPARRSLRRVPLVALATAVVGCSLSLRGMGNPGGAPSSTATPFVAGGPPTVMIASPITAGSTGQTIDVDVRGSDAWTVGVARLELFAGDALVDRAVSAGGADRASFGAILEWTPLMPGPYTLAAFAYRADGTASQPATITVVITGAPITPSPAVTTTLSTPSPFPSATLTPAPTVSTTPKPTPSPTPTPIAVHADVWVDDAELPDWMVGRAQALVVHVQNIGGATVPYVRIVATLAGSTGKARTGSLVPGQETTVAIQLTPQSDGEKKLTVTGKLPAGYYDSDPVANTLVWARLVTVSPAPTAPPSPTPSPTPIVTPTLAPTPSPSPKPHH